MIRSLLCGLAALALPPATLIGVDTVTLVDGESRTGWIWGVEREALVLFSQPIPELPAVDVRIPKTRVAAITFGADAQREAFLQNSTREHLPELAKLWSRYAPLLSVRGSPTARIGLRYGGLLLEAEAPARTTEPLVLFEKIAQDAPTQEEQEAAKQGILRALLRDRQWDRAESEATAIAKTKCGTPLLAEARLTVGMVQKKWLQEFIADNPKWAEDEFATPERDRLHCGALDNLLGAALLPGVPGALAARARSCALEVFDSAGERPRAAMVAGDIIRFHAGTSEAAAAREWLQTNSLPLESTSK
jgi:hypothetical protein